MTAVATAAGPEDGDDHVVERVPCRCGRLAAIVMDEDDGDVTVSIRCACGTFMVADGDGRS